MSKTKLSAVLTPVEYQFCIGTFLGGCCTWTGVKRALPRFPRLPGFALRELQKGTQAPPSPKHTREKQPRRQSNSSEFLQPAYLHPGALQLGEKRCSLIPSRLRADVAQHLGKITGSVVARGGDDQGSVAVGFGVWCDPHAASECGSSPAVSRPCFRWLKLRVCTGLVSNGLMSQHIMGIRDLQYSPF